MDQCIFKIPFANVCIKEQDGEITHISFTKDKLIKTSNKTLLNAKNEIIQYFIGSRKKFMMKINPDGTIFQKKVWKALLSIKYGQTKYYSDIANDLNSSPRAVGNACGYNKCLIVIPCHRVISKNYKRAGFSSYGGIVHKDILLKNEK